MLLAPTHPVTHRRQTNRVSPFSRWRGMVSGGRMRPQGADALAHPPQLFPESFDSFRSARYFL